MADMTKMVKTDLLLIDYAGYGMSTGKVSLENMEKCGVVAVDFLTSIGYSSEKIRVWTESIGSVAGSVIARDRKVHSIVVLFGVASFQGIVEELDIPGESFIISLASRMIPRETNADRYKKSINKLIFLHSIRDNVIPYASITNMMKSLDPSYELITIDGLHSTPIISRDQFQKVLDFMEISHPCDAAIDNWVESLSTLSKGIEFCITDH